MLYPLCLLKLLLIIDYTLIVTGTFRVVTRYVGSGISRLGSGITAPGSGITSHGIGISSFLRDQGSGCIIFVEWGPNFVTLGIKDQKFGYKTGISYEKKRPCYDPDTSVVFLPDKFVITRFLI